MDTQGQQLDPSVLALTKAIGQTESGGNYNAVGDNGNSHGAYQYQDSTWKQYAKDVLGDENAPMTVENQNKVTYGKIKEWKDQGYTPAQIASKWNSGGFDTYKNHDAQGYNAQQGVNFNVPEYVAKVSQEFRNNMGTAQAQGYNPKPFSSGAVDFSGITPNAQDGQQQPSDTLGSEINSRVQDLTTGLGSLVGGKAATGQTRLSGLLQTGGAIGGAIGDVTNKALELIPGVKGLENLLGKGIGALAQTPAGQSVTNAIQSFSQAHPELAKDIGAGFNIVTAIPIVKGLGAVANVAGDAASSALKNVAERGVQSDLESVGTKGGIKAATFFSKNPDIAKDMVQERAIPDVANGKYNSVDAINQSNNRISQYGEQVQSILSDSKYAEPAFKVDPQGNVITGEDPKSIIEKVKSSLPNAKITDEQVIANARRLTPQNDILWDKFENGQATMQEINRMRSDLDAAVKSVYTSTNEPPFNKELGAQTAGAMRQYVQTNAPETRELFANMTKEYRMQKALGYLHNKTVPIGRIAGLVKHVPVIGDTLEKIGVDKLEDIKQGILKRTGKNAVRTSLSTAGKRAGVMAATAAARKAISSKGKGE